MLRAEDQQPARCLFHHSEFIPWCFICPARLWTWRGLPPKAGLMAKQVIAVDFDHTIFDNAANAPMEGAQEALAQLHEAGHGILIHSCNNKGFIEEWLTQNNIHFDWIWDGPGKPVAALYADDRGYRFEGDWVKATEDILRLVAERPVRR